MNTNTSSQKMIVEVFRETNLKQLTDALNVPAGMMMVEGVLGRVDSENRNKRFYERAEYQKHIDLMSQRILESNGILGELEHPKSMNIDLNNASHKVMSIRLDEDGFVRGTVLLLDTPKGLIAQSVVRSGSPLPISSRAVGRVQENGSVKLDYMSTFDIVGIAGFKEAALSQTQRVSESFNEAGNLICEMYEYDINDQGDVVSTATMTNIVESVKATLLEQFIPAEEVNRLVEEKFNEMKASMTAVNEGAAEANVISEEAIVSLMNDRFANVYSPIVESWITSQFAPQLGSTIQEWLANDYANVLDAWVKEDVLTANADLTESWITSQFAPQLGETIQEWLSSDYATLVESWLTNDFATKISEDAKTIAESAIDSKIESLKLVVETVVEPVVEEATVVARTITESANIFKSKLLKGVDDLINEANAIEVPVASLAKQIDESNFYNAPTWLKMIPSEHKVLWQSMNESQKEQVYRRASVRHLVTESEIGRFWNQIDFSALMTQSSVIKRDTMIVENAVAVDSRKAAIIANAKQLQNRN